MESVRTDRLEDTEVLFILVRAGLWEKFLKIFPCFPDHQKAGKGFSIWHSVRQSPASSIRDCANFRTNCFHPNSNCFIGWQPLTGSKEPISG